MPAGQVKESRYLALLVAAPWKGETAMHDDLVAMRSALRRRGFASEEILELEGQVSRDALMTFLASASQKIEGWDGGEVLLYYSGHGGLTGDSPATARAGLWLDNTTETILWDEVFSKLQMPVGVKLILLPDS